MDNGQPDITESHAITIVPQRHIVQRRSIFTLSDVEYSRMVDIAERLSRSSLSYAKAGGKTLTKDDLFLIMAKGIEVGFELMAAIESIDIIQGRPTLDPAGMLALCQARGALEDIQVIKETDAICEMTMIRRGQSPYTRAFTIEQAARMTTTEWENGQKRTIPLTEKHNWKQQPNVMLKWRLVSAMCRFLFGDIIQGLMTPEELGADVSVDDSGHMIVLNHEQYTVEKPKTAGETYLATAEQRTDFANFMNSIHLTKANVDQWLPLIEPERSLSRLSDTTLTQVELEKRLEEIAKQINPATPKTQEQPASDAHPPAEQAPEPDTVPFAPRNPLVCTKVRYVKNGNNAYLLFIDGAMQVRCYGRSDKFKAMVGDTYYFANNFDGMTPYDKATKNEYVIEPLTITWEESGSPTNSYFKVVSAVPATEDTSDEPQADPLEDWMEENELAEAPVI